MRRVLVIVIAAGALAVAAAGTAGCTGGAEPGVPPAGEASAGVGPTGAQEAAIYIPVLRRYLSTPAENSFPGHAFKTVYVLDQAFLHAGNPVGNKRGTPIAPTTQHQITAALTGIAHVTFIADRDTVIETRDGCAQVKDGGILITLGTPDRDDRAVEVAINGFVACLGATWLTYVVQHQPGTGWRVTGTTGPMGIA